MADDHRHLDQLLLIVPLGQRGPGGIPDPVAVMKLIRGAGDDDETDPVPGASGPTLTR